MEVFGRYRNLIVLVGVLFAQILGLAVQVRRTTDTEPTRLIRIWAVGSVSPLEKGLLWFQNSTDNIWHNYFYLRGVRAENRELKHEIEQMRLEQVRITQDADQARRLQALLAFKEQFISGTLAAQVIGSSGSELSRSVYIDKGERDGLKPDMAVLTKDGIVGKVLRVYGSTALVLLIDDQTSGVGSLLEKSRLQGILRGTPAGAVVLEKVMSDETVPIGEEVVTSGGDGIFPKGLPVGTVTGVSPGSDLFLNIRVRPAADLGRLEEVLVVTKVDEKQAEPDETSPMRAVDILAERLPTVPPKPDATSGSPAPGAVAPGPPASNGVASSSPAMKPTGTNSSGSTSAAPKPVASNSSTLKSGSPNSAAPGPAAANTFAPKSAAPKSGAAKTGALTSVPSAVRPANSNATASQPAQHLRSQPAATGKPNAPPSAASATAGNSAPPKTAGSSPSAKPVTPSARTPGAGLASTETKSATPQHDPVRKNAGPTPPTKAASANPSPATAAGASTTNSTATNSATSSAAKKPTAKPVSSGGATHPPKPQPVPEDSPQ